MNRKRIPLFVGLFLAALVGCSQSDPTQFRPLVFVFQKQKNPDQIQAAATRMASYLRQKLGTTVKTFVPTSYSASVQALISKQADIAYVSAIPFMLAKRDAGVELLLAEQRIDVHGVARTDYDSVFVVHKDSPLQSMDDLASQASQLRMAFTSPQSTSGYVMANWRLIKEGVLKPSQNPQNAFAAATFAGSYTQALQQVLDQRADVCAVSYYTVEGPSAKKYVTQQELKSLRVLARTPGVPTHLICVRHELDATLKARIKKALLDLNHEHPSLLEDVYGAKQLVEVDSEQHLAKAVEAAGFLQHLGITIDRLVDKTKIKKHS